jgi:hypothetical protein
MLSKDFVGIVLAEIADCRARLSASCGQCRHSSSAGTRTAGLWGISDFYIIPDLWNWTSASAGL